MPVRLKPFIFPFYSTFQLSFSLSGIEIAVTMAHAGTQYESGLELNQYGAVEAQYQGMEINQYPGNSSDDGGSEKPAFHMNGHEYQEDPRSQLHRDLKTRQLSMIALGGALGTGLLINTGPYLAQSGPGSMLIGYALVGVLCYSVMAAMGEMAAWLPIPSGFTGFAHRFVDPALGFALGWNYWFKVSNSES
jgi:amino acid transporter